MAQISVRVAREFSVQAAPETVFAILADVPRSVSHFPRVRQLIDLGGNAYRWEMEPIGTAGISHQVVYACRYVPDPSSRTVEWTPLKGVGNGVIEGRWQLDGSGRGTRIRFHTEGLLDVPVPRLLKSVAEPFVQAEFARSIEIYHDQLSQTFGGRV
ncbi:SRPBCC family protein [Fontimonas sp. SYSU GA230001]|uniref:SRPBCC family protein n=1 Tax=Fontimonas sp. SYSU GA230001 TaxID=3142450 RepID=UPI0032B55CF6